MPVKPHIGQRHLSSLVDEQDVNGFVLRFVPIAHNDNQSSSPEEADCIREIVAEMLGSSSLSDLGSDLRECSQRRHGHGGRPQ
jgi:hypothetical protein